MTGLDTDTVRDLLSRVGAAVVTGLLGDDPSDEQIESLGRLVAGLGSKQGARATSAGPGYFDTWRERAKAKAAQ